MSGCSVWHPPVIVEPVGQPSPSTSKLRSGAAASAALLRRGAWKILETRLGRLRGLER